MDPQPHPHMHPISVPRIKFAIFSTTCIFIQYFQYPTSSDKLPPNSLHTSRSFMHSAVKADVFLQSLALSVARNTVGANLPLGDILKSEGVTEREYTAIAANPTYVKYLQNYTNELIESGFSFEAKCRVLAEDMLANFYHLGRDMDTPAPVRAKVMENLVEWANLKPKKDSPAMAGAGFSIQIVLPEQAQSDQTPQTVTVDVTPDPVSESQTSENFSPVLELNNPETTTELIEHNSVVLLDTSGEEVTLDTPAEKMAELQNWVDEFMDSEDPLEYPEE